MFQPNPAPVIKKVIPTLIRSKVAPVWLLAAVVATQVAINVATQPDKPICTIELQNVHQSTHSKKILKKSEAKVKIKTKCDVPQEITSLKVTFEEEISTESFELANAIEVNVKPEVDTPNVINIKDATVPCNGQGQGNYRARADGLVRLMDGRVETVHGVSPNSLLLKCRISAK